MMTPDLDRRNRRDHHVITTLMVTMMMMMTVGSVLGELPSSPAEDSRGHHSERIHGNGKGGGRGGDGYISHWNRDWETLGNPNPGKCIDIPSNLTLCGNIGYDRMRLPNLLEHETLREVSQQASSWVRLLAVRCHPDTQVFLCSLFSPVCLDRPIWPCRSLCESVKAGCEDRMLKYGFPWPDMLRCDQFPAEDDLCIGLRNENHKDSESVCSACQSDTFETAVDHYCRAEFVMRVKVKQAIVTGTDLKIETDKKKKNKIYKTGSLKSNELRDASLFVAKGSSCDCPPFDSGTGRGRNSSSFIVMGNMVDDRPVLSFVHRIDPKSKEINRALRVARKPDACAKSAVVLDGESGPVVSSASATKTGNQAKGKKSSHGKEARVKGASGSPYEWKPTTPKSRANPMTTGRKSSHPVRAIKRQQNKKTTEITDPQEFY